MSEQRILGAPVGQLHGARRRRARPQGQAPRRAPGEAAQLPAPLQAGRALVHRVGHGDGDARRRRDRAARRATPSTSRWRARTASPTRATPTSSSSRCSTARTSARTTSSGSRTTYGRVGRRRDADRGAAGGRPDVLLRVLPAQERQGAGHARPHHRRAAAARAVVRLGHLPRRRRVAAAHLRPRVGHAAHDQAQPDGAPHLRGPHPPGAGRHPGLAAQGRRREPDGARRRPARGPRRRPRRARLRRGAGGAGPRHRRLLRRRGGPPGRPPPLAPTCRATATSWRPSSSWPTSG